MAAQALYLKYRPMTFEEVMDQEPITRTLLNALHQDKLRHAYLFTGPRGTGKTTTARLLAKAINCQASVEDRPCNVCPICVAINEGRLLDLIEIDAASNRGIDEIRDIREKVGFRPNEARFKVYVLDEAHMLTEPAFNALLKTLEEPPPHVIFTLVTTDPHKIPATITSRCQRFDFKRLPLQAIVDRLAYIAEQEGMTVEPAALELIARQGTGAMRDAISLLDQLTGYGDEISLEQVQMVLGSVASEAAGRLVDLLIAGDVAGGLDLINRVVGDGADPRQFARETVEYLRSLLLVREGAGTRLLHATAEQAARMEAQAEGASLPLLIKSIRLFNEAATDLRRGLQTLPQLPLEMALVESVFVPEAEGKATAPNRPAPVAPAAVPPKADAAPPAAEPRRVAEPPMARQTGEGLYQVDREADATPAEEPALESTPVAEVRPAGRLTKERVDPKWEEVLQLLRTRRHLPTEALLRSSTLAEVEGNAVIVVAPSRIILEKLVEAQRKAEIQDALSQVLEVDCRMKVVLASEYAPGPQSVSKSQPAAGNPPAPRPVPDPGSLSDAGPANPALAGDGEVPAAISRWAEEHGAQATVID